MAFGGEVNSLNPKDQTPLDIATQCHPDGDIVTLLVSVGGQTGQYLVHEKLSFPSLIVTSDNYFVCYIY